jgi:hypothetical protein
MPPYKKILVFSLILLVLFGIGTLFYLRSIVSTYNIDASNFSPPLAYVLTQPLPKLPQTLTPKNSRALEVIAWQPQQALLKYYDENGNQTSITIASSNPMVIINTTPGADVNEAIIFDSTTPHWQQLFCQRDALKLDRNPETQAIQLIRNQGPRTCAL